MKKLFNYCFYRIAKGYKFFEVKYYCDSAYAVLFTTFCLLSLSTITIILYCFHSRITEEYVKIIIVPFPALLFFYTFFVESEKKYKELEEYYKNEKNKKLKGWLIATYVVGSLLIYFLSLYFFG